MYEVTIHRAANGVKFTCNGLIAETITENGQMYLSVPCANVLRPVADVEEAIAVGERAVINILKAGGVFNIRFRNA